MSRVLKLVVSLTVLAAAVLLWLLLQSNDESDPAGQVVALDDDSSDVSQPTAASGVGNSRELPALSTSPSSRLDVPSEANRPELAAPPSEVRGRVMTVDGRPVGDAAVSLLGRGWIPTSPNAEPSWRELVLSSVATESDGTFSINVIEADQHAGERPVSNYALVVEASGLAMVAIELRGGIEGGRNCGTVVLEGSMSISGVVVNESAEAIVGARLVPQLAADAPQPELGAGVDAVSTAQYLSTVSDESGAFSISSIPSNVVIHLHVGADGYLPVREIIGNAGSHGTDDIRIVMVYGWRVCVDVVDSNGVGIPNAQVWALQEELASLTPPEDGLWVRLAVVEHSGLPAIATSSCAHLLSGLQETSYDVIAIAEGFEPASQRVEKDSGVSASLTLVPLSRRRVRVAAAADSRPIATATLRAARHSASFIAVGSPLSVLPISEGTFELLGGGSFPIEVTAEAPGFAPWSGTLSDWLTDPSEVRTILLKPANALEVYATTTDFEPLEGVSVYAVPTSPEIGAAGRQAQQQRGTTAASGVCVLEGMSAGEWAVGASLEGYAQVATNLLLPATGEHTKWHAVLVPGAAIAGKLLDAKGELLIGETITAVLQEGEPNSKKGAQASTFQQASTNVDGEFLFAGLAAGRWLVGGEGGVLAEVQPGERKYVEVRRPSLPVIRGRVLTGSAIQALVIVFDPRIGRIAKKVMAADNGEYSVEVFQPGEYLVHALCAEPTRGVTESVRVRCAFNEHVVADLRLGGVRLWGTCINAVTREPIEGVRIRMVRAEMDKPTIMSSLKASGAVWPLTNERGEFEFYVPPDDYKLTSEREGFEEWSEEVGISASHLQGPRILELVPK